VEDVVAEVVIITVPVVVHKKLRQRSDDRRQKAEEIQKAKYRRQNVRCRMQN